MVSPTKTVEGITNPFWGLHFIVLLDIVIVHEAKRKKILFSTNLFGDYISLSC